MTLMNQEMVYNSVGKKIKADLYEGNAVVLFAYGLSGSGKTFTVFGPDAVDIPEVSFIVVVGGGGGVFSWSTTEQRGNGRLFPFFPSFLRLSAASLPFPRVYASFSFL